MNCLVASYAAGPYLKLSCYVTATLLKTADLPELNTLTRHQLSAAVSTVQAITFLLIENVPETMSFVTASAA